MDTVEFTEEAVKKYLDEAIRHARRERDLEESSIAVFYIDAFQSVRVSLFGELLELEQIGPYTLPACDCGVGDATMPDFHARCAT